MPDLPTVKYPMGRPSKERTPDTSSTSRSPEGIDPEKIKKINQESVGPTLKNPKKGSKVDPLDAEYESYRRDNEVRSE